MTRRTSSIAAFLLLAAACDSDPQRVQPSAANNTDAAVNAGTSNAPDGAGSEANAGASNGSIGASGAGGQSTAVGGNSAGGAGGSDGMQAGAAGSAGSTNLPPEPIPYTALTVSLAEGHFCVLLDDHNVKCWGSGLYGELGDGSPEGVYPSQPQIIVNLGTDRTAQSISVSRHASCALLDDDTVKCWGFSEQLGIGASEPIGDQPSELGDQLPAVDLGAGRTATRLSMGHGGGCAILDDGNTRCWENTPHETFVRGGPAVIQLANGHFPMALFEDGSFGSPESNEHELLDGSPALSIEGDSRNVCALLETGELTCTDALAFIDTPLLDLDTTASFAIHGPFGSSALCILDKQGVVRCQGPLDHPELWMVPGDDVESPGLHEVNLGAKAVQITSGGDRYACAVLGDGRVKCWGDWNRAGNYGAVPGEIRALDLGTH